MRENLTQCQEAIGEAAKRAGRDPATVTLVAVTKYVEASAIRDLYAAGGRDFGESRVQRCVALDAELADLSGIRWHLIGHLQRNKARRALQVIHSLHSLDSVRLATEMERHADEARPRVYIEVNVTREPRKSGASEEEVEPLLRHIQAQGVLAPAGLMTLARRSEDPESSRETFRRLRELRDAFVAGGLLPEDAGLSMGMSNDFAVAVEEGSTVVRIGSRLFEGISPS